MYIVLWCIGDWNMQTCFQNDGWQFRFSRIVDVCTSSVIKRNHSACPTPKLALYEDSNARIELHKRVLLSISEKHKIGTDIIQAIFEYGFQVFHLLYRTGAIVHSLCSRRIWQNIRGRSCKHISEYIHFNVIYPPDKYTEYTAITIYTNRLQLYWIERTTWTLHLSCN